jgi:hypothetical protein
VSHFLTKLKLRPALQTIAIGSSGAAWMTPVAGQKMQLHSVMWQEQQTAEQAIESLLRRLSIERSSAVQWVVAPSLLKHWLQQPPDHVQSLNELHAVSHQRAQHLFGSVQPSSMSGQASTWLVSADWHASRAFLCAALPQNWAAPLMGKESMQDTIVVSNRASAIVSPLQLILSKFQKQFPYQGWLAVVTANTLYLMNFKNKQCVHFRSLQLAIDLKIEELQTIALVEWQRDMLRTQQNSEQLHWLCLMPIQNAANLSNSLLKPLQWHPINTTDIRDFETAAHTDIKRDAQIDLSEVKLAAWCAVQCAGIQA